jgi:hypothetical protein
MISEGQRSRIRRLFFAEHWKIGTISAELGVHHDTVRHALDAPHAFVNIKYRAQATALEPYKGFVQLTLKDHPKLLACVPWPATRPFFVSGRCQASKPRSTGDASDPSPSARRSGRSRAS